MKYTESHEWVDVQSGTGIATVGITQHAQQELGEIVYVELPEVGKEIKAGAEVAVLESTKAAADVYTPVSGKIVAVNEKLREAAELVNQAPESDGWLFKIQMKDPKELDSLMDAKTYHNQFD
ncbi:MAG: glycine cleavage system protein GcvH [Parachlamydiaceae bacterium]|nr:glycine cleavage system protein GcvH [Parachlamydiaceae bacterium]